MLSFVFLGIYWNNHHHLLQAITHVDGRILWANLHLLFWLSLIPFVTAWMGENHFAAWPVALYGVVLLLAAVAYFILTRALIALHGRESVLATAVGRDRKGKVSIVIYARGHPPGLCGPLDFLRPVRPGRDHVAHPRPPDRKDPAPVRCMAAIGGGLWKSLGRRSGAVSISGSQKVGWRLPEGTIRQMSETSPYKDWLEPEEDHAWHDL